MPFKKGFTVKKPTVTVETKKMSGGDCCSTNEGSCCGAHKHLKKFLIILLLLVNIVLTLCVLGQQKSIEAMRVGGYDNYKLLQQVFKSEGFKNQQQQQIQQAIQMYQGNTKTLPAAAPVPAQK